MGECGWGGGQESYQDGAIVEWPQLGYPPGSFLTGIGHPDSRTPLLLDTWVLYVRTFQ